MPVCSQKGGIDDADIGTDTLHLLSVPKREGVIIPMCHEYSILSHRIKVIGRHLHGGTSVASVVVVPVLASHQHRYAHKHDGNNCSYRDSGLFSIALTGNKVHDPSIYCSDCKTDPD